MKTDCARRKIFQVACEEILHNRKFNGMFGKDVKLRKLLQVTASTEEDSANMTRGAS